MSSVSRLRSSCISRGSDAEGSVFDEKDGAGVGGGGAGGWGEVDGMLKYADARTYAGVNGLVIFESVKRVALLLLLLLLRRRSVRRGARIARLAGHGAVGCD